MGPAFVLPQPAARNGKLKAGLVFGWSAAIEQNRRVYFLNVNAPILHRLDVIAILSSRRAAFSGLRRGGCRRISSLIPLASGERLSGF